MAKVSMNLVKKLREKTHVGFMDCKKALEQAGGVFDKAIELLRKKGASVAAKRSENVTNEGVIAGSLSKDKHEGALVEIACETDFAANTDAFQKFAEELSEQALSSADTTDDIEKFLEGMSIYDSSLSLQDKLNELIAKIAESIKVTRITRFSISGNGIVEIYIHPGSKLGTMVMISTDKSIIGEHVDAITHLARELCMQITVTHPLCITPENLDPEIIEKEKSLYKDQLKAEGKPAAMIDSIAEGKMKKFYESTCLLQQKFIKDEKKSVQQRIQEIEQQTGVSITIDDFVRFAIGE